MADPISEETDLDRFKAFVYSSYLETHPTYTSEIEETYDGRYWTLRKFLSERLPPARDSVILDYGCGDGKLLSIARELGYANLVGVDVSKGMLAVAARRVEAELHHGDGLEFLRARPDKAFDVVVAFDVFEHLTRPQLLATCREMARTLKPGGLLLLHVPNGGSPLYGHVLWGDITHERPYTKSSLGQVLLPLGFENLEAFEVVPVAHGWKSAVRAFLWRVIRAATVFRLAVEDGQLTGHILTCNMFLSARKAGDGAV